MSNNRVAILTIHGMGSQGDKPQQKNAVSFSAGLYHALRAEMGVDYFKKHVAWREVFWSDILQGRQEEYVRNALSGKARWMKVRRFVMHNLTDASAYRKNSTGSSQVYAKIHERVFKGLEHLEDVAGGGTPLIVVAHSLGAHIMSNYIYDLQSGGADIQPTTPFQKMETMCSFVTFGCNIPIFTFSYPPDEIEPIKYPGTRIPNAKKLRPWWLNFNDKDDALGMPLAPCGKNYKALETAGELDDKWINSGNVFEFWNPLSHSTYWTDRHFYKPLAAQMKKAIQIGQV